MAQSQRKKRCRMKRFHLELKNLKIVMGSLRWEKKYNHKEIAWGTHDKYQVREVIAIWVSIAVSIKEHDIHSWLSEEQLWKKTCRNNNLACSQKDVKVGLKLWLKYTVKTKKQRREQLVQLMITMLTMLMFSVHAPMHRKLLKLIEVKHSKLFCKSRVRLTNEIISLLSTTIGPNQDKDMIINKTSASSVASQTYLQSSPSSNVPTPQLASSPVTNLKRRVKTRSAWSQVSL